MTIKTKQDKIQTLERIKGGADFALGALAVFVLPAASIAGVWTGEWRPAVTALVLVIVVALYGLCVDYTLDQVRRV